MQKLCTLLTYLSFRIWLLHNKKWYIREGMMKKDNAESNELGRKFRVLGAAI